jgi:hypothetical protein
MEELLSLLTHCLHVDVFRSPYQGSCCYCGGQNSAQPLLPWSAPGLFYASPYPFRPYAAPAMSMPTGLYIYLSRPTVFNTYLSARNTCSCRYFRLIFMTSYSFKLRRTIFMTSVSFKIMEKIFMTSESFKKGTIFMTSDNFK